MRRAAAAWRSVLRLADEPVRMTTIRADIDIFAGLPAYRRR
jgi:hypothetical protein